MSAGWPGPAKRRSPTPRTAGHIIEPHLVYWLALDQEADDSVAADHKDGAVVLKDRAEVRAEIPGEDT